MANSKNNNLGSLMEKANADLATLPTIHMEEMSLL